MAHVISFLGLNLIQITVRQIKYLNNIVEQHHRGIKRITQPMMGFKKFYSAEAALSGIELHRMLGKTQHIHSKVPKPSQLIEPFGLCQNA